jgi:hypothetical protein
MRRLLLAVLLSGSALFAAPRALACSLVPEPEAHTVDTALKATDTTPPARPTITLLQVIQDHDSPPGDSCGDVSSLSLELSATDDQSPMDKLGFELEVVGGALPKGLVLPTEAVRTTSYNANRLTWTFGESNQDFSFALRVTAIDEAGNRSTPSDVVLEEGEHELAGCSAAGPTPPAEAAGAMVTALLVAGILRSRRAQRDS